MAVSLAPQFLLATTIHTTILANTSTMKMEAEFSFEILVPLYQNYKASIPEDAILNKLHFLSEMRKFITTFPKTNLFFSTWCYAHVG
jgi:hypothetical protein